MTIKLFRVWVAECPTPVTIYAQDREHARPVKGGTILPETLAQDPALRIALTQAIDSGMEIAVMGYDDATGAWTPFAPEMPFNALLAPSASVCAYSTSR